MKGKLPYRINRLIAELPQLNLIPLISLLCLAIGVGVLVMFSPTESVRFSLTPLPEAPHWRAAVHLAHNGWFVWRDALFGDLFGGAELLIPALLTWIAGTALVLLTTHRSTLLTTSGWLLSGITFASFIVGRDPVTWSCIAGTTNLSCALSLPTPTPRTTRLLAVGQPMLILLSGALSLQFFPLALAISLFFTPPTVCLRLAPPVWAGIGLVLLMVFSLTPPIPVLDYPRHARVTDWVEATDMVHALVGPSSPIQFIDTRGIQSRLVTYLAMIAIWLAGAFLISAHRRTLLAPLIGTALVFLDTLPIRRIQETSILLALGRLFPHGVSFPCAWILAGYLPLLCAITVARSSGFMLRALWTLATVGGAVLTIRLPALPPAPAPTQELITLSPNLLFTPSRVVVEQSTEQVVSTLRNRESVLHPIASFDATITASANTPDARKLIDPPPGWRWTSGGGAQRGTEWLAVRVAQPELISGITIDSGDYLSDFARGISVLGTPSCPPDWDPAHGQLIRAEPLATIDHWRGPIAVTPKGLLYYGPLTKMTVFFARPTTMQCLLIRQTGTAPYDWSIMKIGLWRPTNESAHDHSPNK